MKPAPYLSVVVPVHNGSHFLERSLAALRAAPFTDFELLVADDASTDGSAAVARRYGARVLPMPRQAGPAAARNAAVCQARGEIVFFVDADVVVAPAALGRVAECFRTQPEVAAVFGSYDDQPAEPNFLSQYRNLLHHFVHQRGQTEASTFWGGCGAVRRAAFLALGGFAAHRFPRPSIEDIELGYRLRAAGYRIRLDKQLQGKHLKRWTLVSWLRADIRDRAIPWSLLIFESGKLVNDLNLRTSERLSAICALLAVGSACAAPWFAPLLWGVPLGLTGLVLLNGAFFQFLRVRRGWRFALAALPAQVLYYCYSSLTFALCWLWYHAAGKPALGGSTPLLLDRSQPAASPACAEQVLVKVAGPHPTPRAAKQSAP